jgi:hypothetical protein
MLPPSAALAAFAAFSAPSEAHSSSRYRLANQALRSDQNLELGKTFCFSPAGRSQNDLPRLELDQRKGCPDGALLGQSKICIDLQTITEQNVSCVAGITALTPTLGVFSAGGTHGADAEKAKSLRGEGSTHMALRK